MTRRCRQIRSAGRTRVGTGTVSGAGVKHVGVGPGPEVFHDRVERLRTVAAVLERRVDQQLPKEVRADQVVVDRLWNVVADHGGARPARRLRRRVPLTAGAWRAARRRPRRRSPPSSSGTGLGPARRRKPMAAARSSGRPMSRSATRAIVPATRTRRWRCPAGGVMPAAYVSDRAADQRLTVTISTALPITRAAKVSHQAVATQSPSGQTSG
jgi:hypothetical protein